MYKCIQCHTEIEKPTGCPLCRRVFCIECLKNTITYAYPHFFGNNISCNDCLVRKKRF